MTWFRKQIMNPALVILSACSFASACGDDNNPVPVQNPPPTTTDFGFERADLVSDIAGHAANTDPNLVNPWGLAYGPQTFFWVADAGTAKMTVYDGNGTAQPIASPLVVNVPITTAGDVDVTGMIFYGGDELLITAPVPGAPATNFNVPSRFIAALTDGSIVAWSPDADLTHALVVADPDPEDVYTGLALATDATRGTLLYTSNFPGQEVSVRDAFFNEIDLGTNAFKDPNLPDDYGPFSVHAINGQIYVAYAKIDPATHEEMKGLGNGYVDIYTTSGALVRRFVSQGQLNAPWGIAAAPSSGFGLLNNTILIGNFGDGRIHAYNKDSGALVSDVHDRNKTPFEVKGLWAISFGNDAMAGSSKDLFFTAGIEDEEHGLFGRIRALTQ